MPSVSGRDGRCDEIGQSLAYPPTCRDAETNGRPAPSTRFVATPLRSTGCSRMFPAGLEVEAIATLRARAPSYAASSYQSSCCKQTASPACSKSATSVRDRKKRLCVGGLWDLCLHLDFQACEMELQVEPGPPRLQVAESPGDLGTPSGLSAAMAVDRSGSRKLRAAEQLQPLRSTAIAAQQTGRGADVTW